MFRVLLSLIVLAAGLQSSPAASLPSFPQQAHVANGKEVKAYWTRTLRWKCRNLRSRSAINDKKRLIKAIEAGLYDHAAEIAALRSNIEYLEFHQLFIAAQRAKDRIAAIRLEQANIAAAARPQPPIPAAAPVAADGQPEQQPEVIYIEDDYYDEDCPPHETHDSHIRRPHRPHHPGRPHVPIPITPGKPPSVTPPSDPSPAPKAPKGVVTRPSNRIVTQPVSRPSKPPASYSRPSAPRTSNPPPRVTSSPSSGSSYKPSPSSSSSSGSSSRPSPSPSPQPSAPSRPSPSFNGRR